MTKLLTLASLLTAILAQAAIRLDVETETARAKSTGMFIVNENEPASLQMNDLTTTVIARTAAGGTVEIKGEIHDGKERIGQGSLVTPWNKRAEIAVTEGSGQLRYRLAVTPSQE